MTSAERRVLAFLATTQGWVAEFELRDCRLLERGDAAAVPALLVRKLVELQPELRAVKITLTGLAELGE